MIQEKPIFSELVKWERHNRGHSLGRLELFSDHLCFVPHRISILDKGFSVSLCSVARVSISDNWLWRGAVNIHLVEPLEVRFEFEVDEKMRAQAMKYGVEEQDIFCSDQLRLFLGGKRKQFVASCETVGIKQKG